MANATEIQNRIKSIKDTMKITKAMYMISSTKLQKAKQNLEETSPFFYGLQAQISRVLRHVPDFEDNYFENRPEDKKPEEVRRTGYLVVTADKGMAGAYNHNVLKRTEELLLNCKGQTELFVVGELGRRYFTTKGMEITEQFHYTAQNPTMHRARTIAQRLVTMFDEEKLDEIYVVYTGMVNSMVSEVRVEQLLPLKKERFVVELPKEVMMSVYLEEFKMIPSAKEVINRIIPDYITGYIYGSLVESYSSEQNARMMAMKSATDSAQEILQELSVEYNRVRQSAITREINEVIGGAKALKRKKKAKKAMREGICV